jgi:singapore isolate B (sub-type 7) whole genome shotgun sequence assembly, scaffold_6
VSWSRDAQPTGPEDESAILNAIGTAVDSVWSSIRMATRRSNEEDEETWKKRRNEAYRQLAPLLDRVSRLSGDASALLTFMGEGNHIPPGPPIHQPSLSLPPIPSISREEEDPCEGMSNRIRSGFNDGDVVIVLNRNEPQTVVVPIDESGIQDQVVQSLQQLFSRIDEPETDSAPISNALSESIQTEQTTHLNPSLLFV